MQYVDIEHKELGKFRRIKGTDPYVIEQKVKAQQQTWNEQWERKCAIHEAQLKRQKRALHKEAKKSEAITRTEEAQKELASLSNILAERVDKKRSKYWEGLYDRSLFPQLKPSQPNLVGRPAEPSPFEALYQPHHDFFSWLFPSILRRRERDAGQRFLVAHEAWLQADKKVAQRNAALQARFVDALNQWNAGRAQHDKAQVEANEKVAAFRARYDARDKDAVTEYTDIVLSACDYPGCFPKQWQIDFVCESGVMVIDYELPSIDKLPKLKAVKYIQSRDVFEEVSLKDGELSNIYDNAMYQIALRTIHDVFNANEPGVVNSITFNGWVSFIDKANGQHARSCIMSLQATDEDIKSVNLSAVDPKTCFRAFKGVGSVKLSGMTPVVPILQLNKSDERFVSSHDVVSGLDEATNLAAISWEEFEYLVRDIFEKEFSNHGGEVKITRASRDHGVDAVAFDPDPIRGGKIVIQAKRYTNVVGVSAVRDLYGTLINEGANRGILVTTSQYGADSYAFAKDKPITLLDGGNLLSLLDRHGHKARIDLVEAKKLGALRDRC